jgi:ComF family protein
MKYRFIRSLADDIGTLTNKYLEKNKLLDTKKLTVIPVPLHRLRLNWRGFNQSEIVAGHVAAHFRFEMRTDILRRIKHSIPQAEIHNRNSRIENIKNSFACKNPGLVTGKTILLIDDVSTTGSTLNACAEILKNSGAKEVIGLVFARN